MIENAACYTYPGYPEISTSDARKYQKVCELTHAYGNNLNIESLLLPKINIKQVCPSVCSGYIKHTHFIVGLETVMILFYFFQCIPIGR